ncbi:nuclear transport factor 2 family protein [Sneathiella litorea]|uniref:Nuclear transport factor 2 family protein n=1 Tax=Sneathiella litorea TaxID=2606216 RepID=A0A6L8WCT5_9PROT|nr:nuclear transport factor 2 family protein [Sneathiella litorea]MZR32233.1 nuclear transport factor 2 family protein [Sneathiella litorea]
MTVLKTHQPRLSAYIKYFETLTPETVDDLDMLVREDFIFEDPFNRLTSRSDAKRLFRQMFLEMDSPAFKISASYWNESGQSAILKWRFAAEVHKIGKLDFEGLSEVCFDDAGLILSHVDHWDAASHFYEKLPVLGVILRMIRGKLRLS